MPKMEVQSSSRFGDVPTRESLLSRLRSPDAEESWREFHKLYYQVIYGVARRKGLSPDDAKDAVQETFICLARELPRFRYDRQKGSFKSWLIQITQSKVVNVWRRRARLDPIELDCEIATESFDRHWEEAWEAEICEEAYRRLRSDSPRNAQIYHLNIVQKRGAQETARIMRISVAGVHMATFKAKRALRKHVLALTKAPF